jgi:hypothetical protein
VDLNADLQRERATDTVTFPDYTLRPTSPTALPDPSAESERLRLAVRALQIPSAAHRAAAPRSSVYSRAAAAVPDEVRGPFDREALTRRFRTVETSVLLPGTSLLLHVLPDRGDAPAEFVRTATTLAGSGARAVLLGAEMPRHVPRGAEPATIPLRRDDPLAGEWALVACGPAKRVAFLARETAPGQWMAVLTRDALAVQRAATGILERVPFLSLRVPALTTA